MQIKERVRGLLSKIGEEVALECLLALCKLMYVGEVYLLPKELKASAAVTSEPFKEFLGRSL